MLDTSNATKLFNEIDLDANIDNLDIDIDSLDLVALGLDPEDIAEINAIDLEIQESDSGNSTKT